MSNTSVITARIDADTAAGLDRLAKQLDRSRAWIVAKVVTQAVKAELEFQAFVQEGEDAIDRGEFYTQQEMEAWFEQRIKSRATDQAAE